MPPFTYYVVLPFVRSQDGNLLAIEAERVSTNVAAAMRANMLVGGQRDGNRIVGAIAFSRSGDPNLGRFERAVMLRRYGDTPDRLYGLD